MVTIEQSIRKKLYFSFLWSLRKDKTNREYYIVQPANGCGLKYAFLPKGLEMPIPNGFASIFLISISK